MKKTINIFISIILTLFFAVIFSCDAFAQEMTLFVSDNCQYCNELKEYLNANNLYHKKSIIEYEVSNSTQNANLYLEKSGELNYTGGGIPLLITNSEKEPAYIEGKTPIINYLSELDGSTAPPITTLSDKDSIGLNMMIEDTAHEKPDSREKKEAQDFTQNSSHSTKTTIIGILAIIFGLTLFSTIIYRAKKRFKL